MAISKEELTKTIPGPLSQTLHQRRNEAVPRGPINTTPLYARSAKGAVITDVDGNQHLDFAGGIGIQNVGHSHPKVVQAIQEQAAEFIHPCFHVVPYEKYVELAEKLNQLTPGTFKKKTMFANSGAEAVENAVKIARKATGRKAILSFQRAFHGRTLLAMSLTSKVKPYKDGFGPFAPDTYKLPYPYYYRAPQGMTREDVDHELLQQIEQFFLGEVGSQDVAAIIMEPMQGEGGFIVPSKAFVQGVKAIAEKHNILFIADEIQAGFGRTGKLFGIEHFEVVPDIMTLSKSIAAGMPLSAVTGRAEWMDTPEPGQLGGTFGGSPVACAAGLAVLEIIKEENLVHRAEVIGKRMKDRFEEMKEKYSLIGDVRGLGAMVGMELVKDRKTKEPAKEETVRVVTELWQNGLVGLSAGLFGNVVRFLPPLVITDEQLESGLNIIERVISTVQDSR